MRSISRALPPCRESPPDAVLRLLIHSKLHPRAAPALCMGLSRGWRRCEPPQLMLAMCLSFRKQHQMLRVHLPFNLLPLTSQPPELLCSSCSCRQFRGTAKFAVCCGNTSLSLLMEHHMGTRHCHYRWSIICSPSAGTTSDTSLSFRDETNLLLQLFKRGNEEHAGIAGSTSLESPSPFPFADRANYLGCPHPAERCWCCARGSACSSQGNGDELSHFWSIYPHF